MLHVKFVEYAEFRTIVTPERDDSQTILNTQSTGTNYLYHISNTANGLNYLDRRVTSLEFRRLAVVLGRWPFRISAAIYINTTEFFMGFHSLSIQIRSQYLTRN